MADWRINAPQKRAFCSAKSHTGVQLVLQTADHCALLFMKNIKVILICHCYGEIDLQCLFFIYIYVSAPCRDNNTVLSNIKCFLLKRK